MVAHRWWRNLAGSTAVLVALLAVVFGLPALDRAVPVDRDAATAQRQEIAAGVSVIPPVGALVAKRSKSGADNGSVLYLVGPARYVVTVAPYQGDLPAASSQLRTKIQSMRGYQVTAGEVPLSTVGGLSGLSGSFTAPGRIGKFATFVIPGHVVEVTVNGSEGGMGAALVRVDESIASLTTGAVR